MKEKILFVIGKRAPEGATEESQITHYKVAKSLKDAKAGIGSVIAKDEFIKMLVPGVKLKAFNILDGKTWDLEISEDLF